MFPLAVASQCCCAPQAPTAQGKAPQAKAQVDILSCPERAGLITDVVLSILAVLMATGIVLTVQHIDLGPLNALSELGIDAGYITYGVVGGVFVLDIGLLLAKMRNHISALTARMNTPAEGAPPGNNQLQIELEKERAAHLETRAQLQEKIVDWGLESDKYLGVIVDKDKRIATLEQEKGGLEKDFATQRLTLEAELIKLRTEKLEISKSLTDKAQELDTVTKELLITKDLLDQQANGPTISQEKIVRLEEQKRQLEASLQTLTSRFEQAQRQNEQMIDQLQKDIDNKEKTLRENQVVHPVDSEEEDTSTPRVVPTNPSVSGKKIQPNTTPAGNNSSKGNSSRTNPQKKSQGNTHNTTSPRSTPSTPTNKQNKQPRT